MFLNVLLYIFGFVAGSVSLQCSKHLLIPISLVEKSAIEFGCQPDSEFTQCSLVNKQNTSERCTFSHEGSKVASKENDCIFGRRISFAGNFGRRQCRFRIDPVLHTGWLFATIFLLLSLVLV